MVRVRHFLFVSFSSPFPLPFLFPVSSCTLPFPSPFLFPVLFTFLFPFLFRFLFRSFSFRFPFLFLPLSFSSPFRVLSFPFLYYSFSFSLSSLMWILWSRCESSAWKNDKRKKKDNVWKNHLKGLEVFTTPQVVFGETTSKRLTVGDLRVLSQKSFRQAFLTRVSEKGCPDFLDSLHAGVEAGQAVVQRSKACNVLSQCTLEVMALWLGAIQAVVARCDDSSTIFDSHLGRGVVTAQEFRIVSRMQHECSRIMQNSDHSRSIITWGHSGFAGESSRV